MGGGGGGGWGDSVHCGSHLTTCTVEHLPIHNVSKTFAFMPLPSRVFITHVFLTCGGVFGI